MKLVLRGDPGLGDEEGPTPGAPCLRDLGVLGEDDIIELESLIYTRAGTFYDILVDSEKYEVFLRVYSGVFECIPVLELRIRGCGEASGELLIAAEWPEVSRILIEGDCVELVVPSEPSARISNALEKLGLTSVKPIAFRGSPSDVIGLDVLPG